MMSSPDSNGPQDYETRVEHLAEQAVALIREALQESSETRKKVLSLLGKKLTRGEIRTLVKEVGLGSLRRMASFL